MTDRPDLPEISALRAGVIGIFINQPDSVDRVNHILQDFASLIKGRLGVPQICRKPLFNVIALVYVGSTDELGSLAGRLGQLSGVEVKSLMSRTCIPVNIPGEKLQ